MKYYIFLLASFLGVSVYAQKYTVQVNRGQQFEHDSSISTTTAVRTDRIHYLTAGETQLVYTFDFDSMTMTRQYKDEISEKIPMTNNENSNNLIDVFVKFSDGVRNYSLIKNNSNYLFISRTYEGQKITGWFDDSVKIERFSSPSFSMNSIQREIEISKLPKLVQRTLSGKLRAKDFDLQDKYLVNVDTVKWANETIPGDFSFYANKVQLANRLNTIFVALKKEKVTHFSELIDNPFTKPYKRIWVMFIGNYRIDWWFSKRGTNKLETITIVKQ
jgi:hypothetical protein